MKNNPSGVPLQTKKMAEISAIFFVWMILGLPYP